MQGKVRGKEEAPYAKIKCARGLRNSKPRQEANAPVVKDAVSYLGRATIGQRMQSTGVEKLSCCASGAPQRFGSKLRVSKPYPSSPQATETREAVLGEGEARGRRHP